MSCIRPRAPRRDTARGLNSDSASTIAATRIGGISYRTATSRMCASISTISAISTLESVDSTVSRAIRMISDSGSG